jgi:hypothetical protein
MPLCSQRATLSWLGTGHRDRDARPETEATMTEPPEFSKLSRPVHPMPDFVTDALVEHGLLEAYRSRPPYQQNDYVGWITRAKRPDTRLKRLQQMLDELGRGDVYMKMEYRPRDRSSAV